MWDCIIRNFFSLLNFSQTCLSNNNLIFVMVLYVTNQQHIERGVHIKSSGYVLFTMYDHRRSRRFIGLTFREIRGTERRRKDRRQMKKKIKVLCKKEKHIQKQNSIDIGGILYSLRIVLIDSRSVFLILNLMVYTLPSGSRRFELSLTKKKQKEYFARLNIFNL